LGKDELLVSDVVGFEHVSGLERFVEVDEGSSSEQKGVDQSVKGDLRFCLPPKENPLVPNSLLCVEFCSLLLSRAWKFFDSLLRILVVKASCVPENDSSAKKEWIFSTQFKFMYSPYRLKSTSTLHCRNAKFNIFLQVPVTLDKNARITK
jgi:hypothetical protein